jgi:hypothetical protein
VIVGGTGDRNRIHLWSIKPTMVNLRSGIAAGASGGFFDSRPVHLPVVDLM